MAYIDYDYFTQLLERERDELLKFVGQEGMGKQVSFKDSTQELSLYDNHPADTGSELFERSKDLSLHERRLRELEEINMALERIRAGKYGLCLDCGQQIPRERLEGLPFASFCVSCKEDREQREREDRPVEEDNLCPPFKRTFTDGSDYTGYDGEDAWQDVAKYGTSDTPQDVPGSRAHPSFVDSGEDIGTVDRMDRLPSPRTNRTTKNKGVNNPEDKEGS
ncbi:MAG: TraR/DksA C4-type zinc finger protein [Dethiobacteria bacterium]|jgi:YteA family regulatory protein